MGYIIKSGIYGMASREWIGQASYAGLAHMGKYILLIQGDRTRHAVLERSIFGVVALLTLHHRIPASCAGCSGQCQEVWRFGSCFYLALCRPPKHGSSQLPPEGD